MKFAIEYHIEFGSNDGTSIDRNGTIVVDEDTVTTEAEAEQWLLVQFEGREDKLLDSPVVDISNLDFTKIVTEELVIHRCSKVS